MTAAMMAANRDGEENWREYYGRSAEWYVLADLYDAATQQIRVSGNWKKGKAPEFEPYPRPGKGGGKGKKNKNKKPDGPKNLGQMYGQFTGAPAVPIADGGSLWLAQ